jgi:hypothetical protein
VPGPAAWFPPPLPGNFSNARENGAAVNNVEKMLRNRKIIGAYQSGMSAAEIARMHDLTGTRIGQILAANKRRLTGPASELTARIRNCLIEEKCPLTPEAVSKRFTLAELKRVPNMGAGSIGELNEWLKRHDHDQIK